ncbi:recombinase family protein [Nocardia sp. NRRL S-836]|uniref:recombinase family protein n=1 Tax=Nocardia sp. NRRL S-836 TaxID=1519492 RepID=UPI0009E78FC3
MVDDSAWSLKRPEKGLRDAAVKGGRRGRPQQCPRAIVVRVVDAHLAGRSMRAIAEQLNNKGVPTPGGGRRWYSSHVHRLLQTQSARDLIDDRNQNRAVQRRRKGPELLHEPRTARSSPPVRVPTAIPPMWNWIPPEEREEGWPGLTTSVGRATV